ncbi:alpha/beta hydrolase [Pedobacter sp.]|uniref:alpha/beta hydrolase n=1 Tax=Pedobacter sp. TaxID=1411316 RepID=UPI003BA8BD7D
MRNSFKFSLGTFLLLSVFSTISSTAQIILHDKKTQVTTKTFYQRDTISLKLDIYYQGQLKDKKPTVLFVFGGGFVTGKRDNKLFQDYFNFLAEKGFKVVATDYRLGLKGKKFPTPFNTSALRDAIDTAVTDVFRASNYLINNAETFGVDTSMIILSGSSAGAITALHADFNKRNATALARNLPEAFQYKGVISFAGAILSYQGKPKYKIPPAPTMLFHGTADKLVPYNKVRLFNRGFFGSKFLAGRFKKAGYPYYFQYVEGMGHEIAGTPMKDKLPDILWFIQNYIFEKKRYFMEVDFKDADSKRSFQMPDKKKRW